VNRLVAWALAFGCLVFDPAAHAADPKRVVILGVALVVAAAAWSKQGSPPGKGTVAEYTLLAFLLLSAATAAWGTGAGLRDLGTFAGAALVAWAFRPAAAHALARRVGSVVGGGVSLLALLALAGGSRGFALHGGQGNPNWVGLLLAVTLPLSLDAVACAGARRPWPFVAVGLAAVQLPVLFLAHSRVAWVAAALSLATAGILAKRSFSSRRRARGGRAVLAAIGVGALLAVVVMRSERAPASSPPAAHISDDPTPVDGSASRSFAGRLWIWRTSAHAAVVAPFFGAGLGGFPESYLTAQGDALRTLPPREAARRFVNATTAHDEPLQVAIESGVLAALLLVLGLGALVVGHFRAGRVGLGGASLAVLIASLGDSPLRQPAIALLVGLLIAAERPRPASRPIARSPLFSRLQRLVVALAILSAGLLLSDAARGFLAAHVATEASEIVNPEARGRRLAHASRIDPSSGEIRLALGVSALAAGDAALALTHLEAARPRTMGTLCAMGEAALALDDAHRAADAWNAALALHPGSARAHLGLAESEHRLGHDDRAEASLRIAKLLLPGDPRVAAMEDRLAEARSDAPRSNVP
jgi:O-antigen ligase